MQLVESLTMWVTVGAYALSSVAFILAVIFGKALFERVALGLAAAGIIPHVIGIAARWARVGHGPFLGFYEIASLLSLVTVLFLLWIVWRFPGMLPTGSVVMPLVFLMMGGSMLVSHKAEKLAGAIAGPWLAVHVVFSDFAFGCYLAAFILSIGFLLREYGRDGGKLAGLMQRFPAQEVIDDLTLRFIGAGFVFEGIMIASGAIWANEAWGRYWAWDPIEIWSVLTWGVYALYLHLRLTLGWKGRRAAWVAVISLGVMLFSTLGVPIVYKSIHSAYLYH